MWRNEMEIEEICGLLRSTGDTDLMGYALVLAHWVNVINSHSDGWPYWRSGTSCADRLSDLLCRAAGRDYQWNRENHRGQTYIRPGQWRPDPAEVDKAIRPMKACATRHKLPSPLEPLEKLAAKAAAEAEELERIEVAFLSDRPEAPKPVAQLPLLLEILEPERLSA